MNINERNKNHLPQLKEPLNGIQAYMGENGSENSDPVYRNDEDSLMEDISTVQTNEAFTSRNAYPCLSLYLLCFFPIFM